MKKHFLLIALLLVGSMTVSAVERTKEQVRDLALAKLRSMAVSGPSKVASATLSTSSVSEALRDDCIAIWGAEGVGSVIVSLDDRCVPVLGYTSAVIKDEASLPCSMKWWLDDIRQQMRSAGATQLPAGAKLENVEAHEHGVVEPLVSTKWDQDMPYNYKTPSIGGSHTPTGCAATALAQILNYNQYPAEASFTGYYSTNDGRTYSSEEISSTYSYPYNMSYGLYSVDGSETNYANMAYTIIDRTKISTLMRDCGYAIRMMYGKDGSGALLVDVATGAVNCFKYPKEAVKYIERRYYTNNEWYNIVYGEIERGCPVLYGGQDPYYGGHAYVVHGIDADGLVAINWGWNGFYDGYFSIDAMIIPEGSFTRDHHLVYGLRPQPVADDMFHSQWNGTYNVYKGLSGSTIYFSWTLYNLSPYSFRGTVALLFEDMATGEIVGKIDCVTPASGTVNTYNGYGSQSPYSLNSYFSGMLQKGHEYKAYMASKTQDESLDADWARCRVSGGAIYYIVSVNNDGSYTVTGSGYDEVSGVDEVTPVAHPSTDGKTYDAQGRRVGDDYKGLIIKDGKKMIRK